MRAIALGLVEAVMATLALVLAMVLYLGPINATLALGYEQADVRVALVVFLFVLCMYYCDLYDLSVLRNPREVVSNLIQCFGTFFVLLGCVYSMFPVARLEIVGGAGRLRAWPPSAPLCGADSSATPRTGPPSRSRWSPLARGQSSPKLPAFRQPARAGLSPHRSGQRI